MPNNCFFEMLVKGRHEDIEVFRKVATDYNMDRHFWRVFRFEVDNRTELADGAELVSIYGDCAWSVCSCMLNEGRGCYADDVKDTPVATSLLDESERLHLEIEVYSEEYNMGFEEHYHYRFGEELKNECRDAGGITFDQPGQGAEEAFKVFCAEHPEVWKLSQEDLEALSNGNYWIHWGGFRKDGEWEFEMTSEDTAP